IATRGEVRRGASHDSGCDRCANARTPHRSEGRHATGRGGGYAHSRVGNLGSACRTAAIQPGAYRAPRQIFSSEPGRVLSERREVTPLVIRTAFLSEVKARPSGWAEFRASYRQQINKEFRRQCQTTP